MKVDGWSSWESPCHLLHVFRSCAAPHGLDVSARPHATTDVVFAAEEDGTNMCPYSLYFVPRPGYNG